MTAYGWQQKLKLIVLQPTALKYVVVRCKDYHCATFRANVHAFDQDVQMRHQQQ